MLIVGGYGCAWLLGLWLIRNAIIMQGIQYRTDSRLWLHMVDPRYRWRLQFFTILRLTMLGGCGRGQGKNTGKVGGQGLRVIPKVL